MRLLRGQREERIPKSRELPIFIKHDGGLIEVKLEYGGRNVYAKLSAIYTVHPAATVKLPLRRVLLKGDSKILMTAVEKKVLPQVKQQLERAGFKALIYKTKKRMDKAKTYKSWTRNTPWDFIIDSSSFLYARTDEEMLRRVTPKLLEAHPKVRHYILDCMREMRTILWPLHEPGFEADTVLVGFKELKKWLMPYPRYRNVDMLARARTLLNSDKN
jgi:hypothetical protein